MIRANIGPIIKIKNFSLFPYILFKVTFNTSIFK